MEGAEQTISLILTLLLLEELMPSIYTLFKFSIINWIIRHENECFFLEKSFYKERQQQIVNFDSPPFDNRGHLWPSFCNWGATLA
jgi:undecaprenyl pyrophosphate synthase